jgi:hypothetical protein
VIRKLFVIASSFSALLFVVTLIAQLHGNMTVGETLGIWHVGIQDLPATENPNEFAWWSMFPLLPITVVCLFPPLFAARAIERSLYPAPPRLSPLTTSNKHKNSARSMTGRFS